MSEHGKWMDVQLMHIAFWTPMICLSKNNSFFCVCFCLMFTLPLLSLLVAVYRFYSPLLSLSLHCTSHCQTKAKVNNDKIHCFRCLLTGHFLFVSVILLLLPSFLSCIVFFFLGSGSSISLPMFGHSCSREGL